MKVAFTHKFIKTFEKLPAALLEEALQRIELLKDKNNHKALKVHKLHGPLTGKWSFSVNYKIRIIFSFYTKEEIVLLTIGDHKIYD